MKNDTLAEFTFGPVRFVSTPSIKAITAAALSTTTTKNIPMKANIKSGS